MKKYRLYMKKVGGDKFKAVNWKTGEWAPSLLYATIFTEADKAAVEKDLAGNPDLLFEWRAL